MTNEDLYNRKILDMVTVANEYCIYILEIDKYEQRDILNYLHRICPLLYLKGSLLPDISVEDTQANERFVTQEQWESVFNNLRNKFLEKDEFLFISPTEKIDFNPVKYRLSELLADVYQDMKDFIWLFQKTSIHAKTNAVMECKRLFEQNWGIKLSIAQNAIHSQLYAQSDIIMDPSYFDH